MNLKVPSVHVTEALLRASEQAQPPRAGEGARYTIALSREAGARATSVGRAIGTRLNWPVYDREILEQIAKDMNVGLKQLERLDEKAASWFQEIVDALTAVPTVSEPAYFRRLVKLLLSLSVHGECVIVGRAAAQLLPVESTLRVRFVASRDDRVAAVTREMRLSAVEAERYVDNSDRERVRFVQEHCGKDPNDARSYDLVLNTSRLLVEECAEVIIAALHRLQARARGVHPMAGQEKPS